MKKSVNGSYRSFVRIFLVFFFLCPLGIGLFNYREDPNHRYRFGVSETMLRQLFQDPDKVLVLPSNIDDRAFLKKAVRVAEEPPSAVILGGSRSLNIHGIFNASVSRGTIRDYVALWQLMKQTGFSPNTVYLCIEEQSLNSTSQNNAYLPLYEYYEAFFQRGLSFRVRFMGLATDLKDLLSLETTVASLRDILLPKRELMSLVRTADYDNRLTGRTASLSILYPKDQENRDILLVEAEANSNGQGELKIFLKWNRTARSGYDQLKALIQDIKKSGGNPVIIGMPYHPTALEVIAREPRAYENLLYFVNEIKQIAVSEQILFYDAIIERRSDLNPKDFMDGVHLKTIPNNRLFEKVLTLRTDRVERGAERQSQADRDLGFPQE